MSALGLSNSVSLGSTGDSGSDLSSLGLLILTDFIPAALLLLRVIILDSSPFILFRPLSSPYMPSAMFSDLFFRIERLLLLPLLWLLCLLWLLGLLLFFFALA